MSITNSITHVKNQNFLVISIALGVILNPLNTTMITVALPEIRNEFLLTSNEISWLIASYFIVSAIFLPLIGKLSDYYGRKSIFLLGLLLVGISSFTAPLSPNMPFLLAMRAIQAIGTSALYPAGIGIIFEKKKSEPFIDVVFLKKNLNISFVYIQYILATVIFFALLLSIPTYLQSVLKLTSRLTGLMMLSISIFAIIITPLATRWIDRSGYRIPLLTGGIIGLLGSILFLTINQSSPLLWIFIVLSTIGLSNGILNIGLQTLLYSFVSVAETGTASGLFMTSRFMGNILASSIYGILFATGVNDSNQQSMTIILITVSIILLPGLVFTTKEKPVASPS